MLFVRQSIGIWIILILISLPFPLDWFPRVGEWVSAALFPITEVFNYGIEQTYSSDSKIYFVQSIILIAPSLLIAWALKGKSKSLFIIHVTLSYLIAFFLLKYGFIKIIQHQFYTVEPNIAYTPVGHLSKDVLFWTSMGTSKSYNIFIGVTELLGGALILYKRTRMLGTLLAVGIFTHVLAINIGFNITVKLLSFTLLAASIFLLSRYRKTLLSVFILHKPITIKTDKQFIAQPMIKRGIKGLIVCLFVLECIYPFVKNSTVTNPNFTGSYQAIKKESSLLFDSVKRIHFHSGGYLITENQNQEFEDYPIVQLSNSIIIKTNNLRILAKEGEDTLHLEWKEHGVQKTLDLQKLRNEALPVYQDNVNWTLESMLKNQ